MNANDVIQKYNTTNPYDIAKINRIVVILEPLGKIYEYYNKTSNQRFIHVNENLTENQRYMVVDHILETALKGQDAM